VGLWCGLWEFFFRAFRMMLGRSGYSCQQYFTHTATTKSHRASTQTPVLSPFMLWALEDFQKWSIVEIIKNGGQHKRREHRPKHKNELHATNHGTVRNDGKIVRIRKYHHQQPPQTPDIVAMATCYCS
jgi:hypothetical protein